MAIQDSDYFLVNRGTESYKVLASTVRADLGGSSAGGGGDGGGFVTGTRMMFAQENPPTGWTFDDSYANTTLRVRPTSEPFAATGGSIAFDTVFASQSISVQGSGSSEGTAAGGGGQTMAQNADVAVAGTSLTGNNMPSHGHKYVSAKGDIKKWENGGSNFNKTDQYTDTAGGNSAHVHSIVQTEHSHYAYGTDAPHSHSVKNLNSSGSLDLRIKYTNICIGVAS